MATSKSITLILGSILIAFSTACSSPTSPNDGGVTFTTPIFSQPQPNTGYEPYQPSSWEPTTNGSPENPTISPNNCDCPAGYSPIFNGHNWLCARGTDREFPAKNNFCNIPH
jgi:hypothetical protein